MRAVLRLIASRELKNHDFTGFASGGEKGLWLSHEEPSDTRLVACESAIECFSHAALFPCPTARYASVGGKLSPKQPALLERAIARLPAGAEAVAAMNSDAEGRKLANVFKRAFAAVVERDGRTDLRFVQEEPTIAPAQGKDWNDQLNAG